jgi:hypothetical protein
MRVTCPFHVAAALLLLGPAAALGASPEAATAGRTAEAPDPGRRPLAIRADLGGTEPGTSRQAFEGVVAYRLLSPWEVQAGWSYTDQVYYQSNRAFVTGYRFFNDGDSYVRGDASLRRYDYPVDPAVQQPNPDSSSYEWVPRGVLEVSHAFTRAVRAGAEYQLFPANFWHDPSSWTVNQKISGEVEVRPVRPLGLGLRAALLRDPDPQTTEIAGRQVNGAPPGTVATRTKVAYRTTSLVGGWGAVELEPASLKVEVLPNRDLDDSYDWSLLTTLDVRLHRRLDLRLQQVHDTYSSASNFPGQTADIWMAAARYAATDAVRLRAGYRYVDAPSRAGGTVILGVEWRTGLP